MSNTTANPWFAISMTLVGIIVGYGVATSQGGNGEPAPTQPSPTVAAAPTPTAAPQAGDVRPVDSSVDHIRGNPNAAISVIEYSDFECPFCQRHHPTMVQIVEEYGDDVNWVYRHYPLSFHPNAQKSAEASECAADQGGNDAFWAFADLLFEKGLGEANYLAYAQELGLNQAEFKSCLDNGTFADKVSSDFTSGSEAGIRGTPGNIVYDNKTKEAQLVSGAVPFATFKTAIDALLN